MATEIQLASGSFGIYQTDGDFINDIQPTILWIKRSLGYPVMEVELDEREIASAFEEATLEYSATVNSYNMRNILSSILGQNTGSTYEGKYPRKTVEFAKRMSSMWGQESDRPVGGDYAIKSAYFTASVNTHSYDLSSRAIDTETGASLGHVVGGTGSFEIKEMWHFEPQSFASQYGGIASPDGGLAEMYQGMGGLPAIGGLGGMAGGAGGAAGHLGAMFFLYPVWEQITRAQHIDTYRRVRRSNYSFWIQNRTVYINPVPRQQFKIHFKYRAKNVDPINPDFHDTSIEGISDVSNVGMGTIEYTNINSVGKHWIRRYALSLCKETLGIIRSKFATLPIPNGEVTLNGEALKAEGRESQLQLKDELRDLLQATQYPELMKRDAETHEYVTNQLKKAPLGIYLF